MLAEILKRAVTLREFGADILIIAPAEISQGAGADVREVLKAGCLRHRPVVQRISPREICSGKPDLAKAGNNRVAVHDVEHENSLAGYVAERIWWPADARLLKLITDGNRPRLMDNRSMTSVRIDKWLWAARFFKTRALAARACELGRIASNQQVAKAAREVRIGDLLQIKTSHDEFEVEVLLLSAVRGPAAVAQTLYRETDASRATRLKAAEERRAMKNFSPAPEGRPSKRDRRKIIQFRDRM